MLEILRFIFQDFKHYIGFAFLLALTVWGLGHMFTVRVKKIVTGDIYDDEELK